MVSGEEGVRRYQGWLRVILIGAMVALPPTLPFTIFLRGWSIQVRRRDLAWLFAASLQMIAFFAADGSSDEVLTLALGLLAFKGGQALAVAWVREKRQWRLGWAFGLALAGLLTFEVLQVAVGHGERVSGPSWFIHPNFFGPVMLVIGFTAASYVDEWWRWLLLTGALIGIVLTGSRSALLAFFVVLALAALLDRRWRRTALISMLFGTALLVTVSVMLPAATWAQRLLSPIYVVVGAERSAKNILVWTEDLSDRTQWNALGVTTVRRSAHGWEPAIWSVERVEPVAWARPQQAAEVARGETYTLSAAFRAADGAPPGFIGWTDRPGVRVSFEVALTENGPEVLRAIGLDAVTARASAVADGWRRLEFTFSVPGTGSTALGLGVSPGLASERVGDTVEVSELQLERGGAATSYAPAIQRTTGVGEAAARGRILKVAWQGVLDAPVFGHGRQSFAEYYLSKGGAGLPPNHAHNAFLQVLFTSGVVGLIAFVGVLGLMFSSVGRLQQALIVGVGVANLFDSTLTSGLVLYSLAFAAAAGTGNCVGRRVPLRASAPLKA